MVKRLFRIAVLAITVPVAVSFATPAWANHSFSLTVNNKATLNSFRTIVTVSGTYTCTEPTGGVNPDFSGLGGQVSQIYKGNTVVSGGGGTGGPGFFTCDNLAHPWSFDVQAFDGNGQPAVWKNGKAIFQYGGGVSDGPDCEGGGSDCAGASGQTVIQLGK